MKEGANESPGEILFEFAQIGQQVRVAAIHAASGTEVVVIAPATATRHQMQQIAAAKLKRRLTQEGRGA